MSTKSAREDKLDEWESIFKIYENKDGKIPLESVKDFASKVYSSNPPTESEIKNMLLVIEPESHDALTFEEVVDLMISHIPRKALLAAFDMFDEDKNGSIDANEIHKVFNKLGIDISIEHAKDLVKMADADNNGVIDFNEFQALYVGLGLNAK